MLYTPISRVSYIVVYIIALSVNASEVSKLICRQQHTQPSEVGQRCITDNEVYINKTTLQHHCTLLCMRNPNCQVINFNIVGNYCLLAHRPCVSMEQNINFVTRYMFTNTPCLKWVANHDNGVHSVISFPAADDPSDLLIVVRGRIGQNKIPGKRSSRTGEMHCSWNDKETKFTANQAEFLTASTECNISWVPHDSTSGKPLPVRAVIGGHMNDTPLYVARKSAQHITGHRTAYSCGYYDNTNGLGHFPYHHIDVVYNQVEVLVVQ